MAIFGVPGSYLNADMPKEKCIILKIDSDFVGIMCEVNPKHKKNVCMVNGVRVTYLWVLKSLYGCM